MIRPNETEMKHRDDVVDSGALNYIDTTIAPSVRPWMELVL